MVTDSMDIVQILFCLVTIVYTIEGYPSQMGNFRKFKHTFSYKKYNDGLNNKKLNFKRAKMNAPVHWRHRFSYEDAVSGLRSKYVRHTVMDPAPIAPTAVPLTKVNADLLDSTSLVHQNLVSSIHKMIVDALVGENIQDSAAASVNAKTIGNSMAVLKNDKTGKIKVGIVSDGSVNERSEKLMKRKPNYLEIKDTVQNSNSLFSKVKNKQHIPVPKNIKTTASKKEGEAKEANSVEKAKQTSAISAEAPTTPEPVEPADNSNKPTREHCFCMSWCPPGTIFNGHCGRQFFYGYQKSICCLPTYHREDDDDYD